tara:strand:- start:3403 stop:3570 length:168 start_codon:yes stop_codon:yes gene_type:complete
MGNFPDFAGKTFKLGIVINAIWEFCRKELQTKRKTGLPKKSGLMFDDGPSGQDPC